MRIKCTPLDRERYCPFFLAALGGISAYFLKDCFTIDSLLFSASVSLGAIVAGFTSTCLAVLISLDSELMRKIRKTKYLNILSEYVRSTMYSGLIFSLIGILGLLFRDTENPVLIIIWSASLVFCLSCMFRLSHLMLEMFSDSRNQPK